MTCAEGEGIWTIAEDVNHLLAQVQPCCWIAFPSQNAAKVAPLRYQAGCFVLMTNLLDQQSEWPARELLSLNKNQIGIEKNFGYLKDPVMVNSISRLSNRLKLDCQVTPLGAT